MSKIKLFCFPYAGGFSQSFFKWKKYLDGSIELIPIEYAGRGTRSNELLYECLEDAVHDTYNIIKSKLDNSEYALWGHSMGSLILFELCHQIQDKKDKRPCHAFLSGKAAPHFKSKNLLHNLPVEEFKSELLKLGGISPELLANKKVNQFFLPIIRADIKIMETYDYRIKNEKLSFDITLFNGKNDEITFEEAHSWGNYTSGICKMHFFEGGHFFINDKIKEISEIINETLLCGQ